MNKVRIPLDVDPALKQDFMDRFEVHFKQNLPEGEDTKVKLNTMIKLAMHNVLGMNEMELQIFLLKASKFQDSYHSYFVMYMQARSEGLFDGLNIKRANPRQKLIHQYLTEYYTFNTRTKEELRKELEKIDKAMKEDQIFWEDVENQNVKDKQAIIGFEKYKEQKKKKNK